jgi:hypothetical protein
MKNSAVSWQDGRLFEGSMRRLLILSVLLLVMGCGSSKLSRTEAEKDLRQDYPVVVDIRVPESASAIKGSPEHAKLVTMQEQLARTGWFTIERKAEGDRERFSYKLAPAAPSFIHASVKGLSIPAAEAEFVKALRLEPERDGLKVTYQIRLAKPTAQFGLFQALHPDVKIGDVKERHAMYKRNGRSWVLQETDETFKKGN